MKTRELLVLRIKNFSTKIDYVAKRMTNILKGGRGLVCDIVYVADEDPPDKNRIFNFKKYKYSSVKVLTNNYTIHTEYLKNK